MKSVIIDNYDSFTYNLRHIVNELGVDVDVLRNDAFDIESIAQYDKIILSPGPGIPREAGLMPAVRRKAHTGSMFGSSSDRRSFRRKAHKPERGISRCANTRRDNRQRFYLQRVRT